MEGCISSGDIIHAFGGGNGKSAADAQMVGEEKEPVKIKLFTFIFLTDFSESPYNVLGAAIKPANLNMEWFSMTSRSRSKRTCQNPPKRPKQGRRADEALRP